MHSQRMEVDPELIRKHDRPGPRYTSYPTAPHLHGGFGPEDFQRAAVLSNGAYPQRPLSLYFHIPFCATPCFYCACNKVFTRSAERADTYLDYLARELKLRGALFDPNRPVDQLHWGGGTPNFLDAAQMRRLMVETARHFSLRRDDGGDYSVEVDPRFADWSTVGILRELGFNRLSVGVQDFNRGVQEAVNRIQPPEATQEVLEAARANGFQSVGLDLIYGLPRQTVESFLNTLDAVLETIPDRLSIFGYAHLPEQFPAQRRIREEDLPSPEEKLAIFQRAAERLTDAGFVHIGMDHFARPEDELARAQRRGELHRNFQGYTTHGNCDLVAMGVSAISEVGGTYSQNVRELTDYYACLDREELPVFRGLERTGEDRLRRWLINRLMCDFALDFTEVEARFGIDFPEHFAPELSELAGLAEDGLLELGSTGLTVTPQGRLLVRRVAMAFDAYLDTRAEGQPFSRVV